MARANLHSHIAPSFENYWLNRTGLEGKNVAQAVAERCYKEELTIYAITSEAENDYNNNRFGFILEHAKKLTHPYELDILGNNAFSIAKDQGTKRVIFLNSQSISIKECGKHYDLLTFGTNKVPDYKNFSETFKFLNGEGLPAIAEHPLCTDHKGIGKQRLIQFAEENKITVIEHNAQLALPNFLQDIHKFKSYVQKRNQEAKEIAEKYGIPFIASDDSNWPSHIGAAYFEFDSYLLNDKNDEEIKNSLIDIIKSNNFRNKETHIPIKEWIRWAMWEIFIRENLLGKKEKWERKHLK